MFWKKKKNWKGCLVIEIKGEKINNVNGFIISFFVKKSLFMELVEFFELSF